MKKAAKITLTILTLALVLLMFFSGPVKHSAAAPDFLFGSAKIELYSGKYFADSTELVTPITEDDIAVLDYFTQLEYADFSGSDCNEAIAVWARSHPEIEVVYSVELPDGSSIASNTRTLDLSNLYTKDAEAMAAAMRSLIKLESVELGALGGERLSAGTLSLFKDAAPQAQFHFSLILNGVETSSAAESVDLSGLSHEEAADAAAALACMPNLKTVELGQEASGEEALLWTDIAMLKAACKEAVFSYSFNLYGQDLTLESERLDFRGTEVPDGGEALYSVLACMNNCTYLDMDSTGVSNETMGELRMLFPQTEMHWRVWFGENYSVRTDAERILASKPTVGGMITDTSMLQYCTKIKYLDVGHNDELADLSFVQYMPDLEICIIAMTAVTDISPLKNCTKLDYLEINSTAVSDLSPLEGLPALRHLNIGNCPNITDISPLFSNTELERFWIGAITPVPGEQVEQMRAAAPYCQINTTVTDDPTGEGWRYTRYDPEIPKYYWVERYENLRNQLGYNYQEYSFYWLDPLCDIPAPPEHAGKYGKEVYGL